MGKEQLRQLIMISRRLATLLQPFQRHIEIEFADQTSLVKITRNKLWFHEGYESALNIRLMAFHPVGLSQEAEINPSIKQKIHADAGLQLKLFGGVIEFSHHAAVHTQAVTDCAVAELSMQQGLVRRAAVVQIKDLTFATKLAQFSE